MNNAPIKISRVIRPLRGGSQAQLVRCEDGHFYAAKFAGNPQGNRTLINEWIAYGILSRTDITTPPLRILELSSKHDDLYFAVGNRRNFPEGTLHLGSQCPVNPETTAIFDFLPHGLLANVRNLADFARIYVYDQWFGQADKRQAVFVRDKSVIGGPNLKAYFVDHGQAFNGAHWALRDMPLSGLAFPTRVYSMIDMSALAESAIAQIETIDKQTLFATTEGVPSSWLGQGDRDRLHDLLCRLRRRQATFRPLIARHLSALDEHVFAHCTRAGFGNR
jgi:hypothetical protein